MNNLNNWYQAFFEGLATEFWAKVVPDEYTQSEIDFIKQIGSLNTGDRILDVASGLGRHAIPLAKQGYRVSAIDISEYNISRLKQVAFESGLNIGAVQADILEYDLPDVYSLAICMGNSFSYFNYSKMQLFVQKVYDSLNNGGKFIINTGVLAESVLPAKRSKEWMEGDGIYFLSDTVYHTEVSALQSDYTLIRGQEKESKTAYHFVYTLAEVMRMLINAGFSSVWVYSDLDRAPYILGSSQAYIVAGKD